MLEVAPGEYEPFDPSAYNITGAGSAVGGSLIFSTARQGGQVILVLGEAILDRLSSVVSDGKFKSALTDGELDRVRLIQQELSRDVKRSVKVDFGGESISIASKIPEGATLMKSGPLLVEGPNIVEIGNEATEAAGIAKGFASDIVSQGNVPIFDNRVTAGAYDLAGMNFVRLNRCLPNGRASPALYARASSEPAHAGKFPGLGGAWWEIVEAILTPEMFGAVGDGTTDDSLAVENFFKVCSVLGLPGRIDRKHRITRNLAAISFVTGKLEITGKGEIYVDSATANKPVQIIVPHEAALAVTDISGVSHTFPEATSSSIATRITAPGHNFSLGELVKIVADNIISGGTDASRRVGEFLFIGDVDGDDIYVAGSLSETYSTNVRICRVRQGARVVWDGPSYTMNWEQAKANNWACEALTIRGAFRPLVRAAFKQVTSAGLNLSSCVQADVDISISQMLNRVSSQGIPGYGVMDACSWQSRIRISGEDARHFYTSITNTSAENDETFKYGRTKDSIISGSALGSSSASFDTHSEADGVVFSGAVSADSRFGEASPGAGFQLRGRFNKLVNCAARGGQVGAQVQALTDGDGIGNEIINFSYDGSGDAIRLTSSGSAIKTKGTRISGGVLRGSGGRLVRAENCDDVFIDQLTLAPTRQAAGAVGILMRGNAKIRIGTLYVDTSQMSAAALVNWRAIGFDLRSVGNEIAVDRVVHIAGPAFQAWFNGNNTSGTCRIFNIDAPVAPTGGAAINTGSMTSLLIQQRGLANHGIDATATEVDINSNAFALDVATRAERDIVIIANASVAGAQITSISSGKVLGQRLTILCKNNSPNPLKIANSPAGLVIAGESLFLAGQMGVSFVWSGYHWHSTIAPMGLVGTPRLSLTAGASYTQAQMQQIIDKINSIMDVLGA